MPKSIISIGSIFNQKKVVLGILILIIIFIVIFGIAVVFRVMERSIGLVLIPIQGYQHTCIQEGVIYRKEATGWQKTLTEIPRRDEVVGRYLDGEFAYGGMCDLIGCVRIRQPYTISLKQYVQEGSKPGPSGEESYPVYRTKSIEGEVKVEVRYYSDDRCLQSHLYTREF